MTLEVHPLCETIPEMDPEAFAALVADIKEHGVKIPIWLYEGKILDGRNRYKACLELGIQCPSIECKNGDEPLTDIVSLNVIRRHLDASQRAMVAARIANRKRIDTLKHGPRSANLQNGSVSVTQAAK